MPNNKTNRSVTAIERKNSFPIVNGTNVMNGYSQTQLLSMTITELTGVDQSPRIGTKAKNTAKLRQSIITENRSPPSTPAASFNRISVRPIRHEKTSASVRLSRSKSIKYNTEKHIMMFISIRQTFMIRYIFLCI